MATATVRGIDVHYERRGSGPRLLLINGTGATLATSQVVLDPFAAHFDLVAHDQRGIGDTTIPEAQPTMADFAEDAAALADHLGWDTFRVAGISFGGMVAQELAVTRPERIERLALLCTSPGGTAPTGDSLASYPLHELDGLPADERIEVGRRLVDSRFSDEWLADHPSDQFIVDVLAQRTGSPRSEGQRRGEGLQLEARRHHDVLDRLGAISCPTLVACGRYDGIAPPVNSEAIAARVPGAELHAYEGGHVFFFQDPTALDEIIAFLAGG